MNFNGEKTLIKDEEEIIVREYESERDLEERFIKSLLKGGYEYPKIKNEEQLILNLREKIELLNSKRIKNFRFSDEEWDEFFKNSIVGRGEDIIDKTEKIQGNGYKKSLKREDGTVENILLIDKENLENNHFQVINQYWDKEGKYRYDVTILVNGLPLVHLELKKPGVDLKTAFNQIDRYKENSFAGLFDFVQIFVISNGVRTKYYANTTRRAHIFFINSPYNTESNDSSHSFMFTSWWSDEKNRKIPDLIEFSKSFLKRETLIKILTKYCVFGIDKKLKVLRPYQIFAIKAIIKKIKETMDVEVEGKRGGYIWHTTGSGKTLTSFKAAQLIKEEIPEVEKIIFVVDRKDLDYKTENDYNSYERGSANSTRNYKILEEFLTTKKKTKIIITTIQKLNHFVKKQGKNSKFKPKTVLLIDECHRSQSGEMNEKIFKFFENANIFGFTGTPIKKADGKKNKNTIDQFGKEIHRYTIVNAINDENVVPFWINEVDSEGVTKEDNPIRIKKNVDYILRNYDKKTHRSEYRKRGGFNSIFATSSISMAKKYYLEFKERIKRDESDLGISIIYSYSSDADENLDEDEVISENGIFVNNQKLDKSSRSVLEMAMEDHNKIFKTNFKLDKNFDDYYKSVSQKLKENKIDMLIVVNMFLTGFDAPTLNTLWVDKNLKMHNLIQAFSRTNRIYNSKKDYGHIVSLRPIKENLDDAIAYLFEDEKISKIKVTEKFEDIYREYKEIYEELAKRFPLDEEIIEGEDKREFINLFGRLLRLKNRLNVFEEFNKEKEAINGKDLQIYEVWYSDLLRERREKKERGEEEENFWEDTQYEPELIRSFQVDVDYIIKVCREYAEKSEREKIIIREEIFPKINSSDDLCYRSDIFENFLKNEQNLLWDKYIEKLKEEEIQKISKNYDLNAEETKDLISKHSENIGEIGIGRDIDRIFRNPISRRNSGLRREKLKFIVRDLKEYHRRFIGL